MVDLIVRDIDEATVTTLANRAARHGLSVEDEAARILADACMAGEAPPADREAIKLQLLDRVRQQSPTGQRDWTRKQLYHRDA